MASTARDPGRLYPPPPVGRWGWAWRLGVSIGWFAFSLLMSVGVPLVDPSAYPPMAVWLVAADFIIGAAMIALAPMRRRWRWLPLLYAPLVSLTASGLMAWSWVLVSAATRRRIRDLIAPCVLTVLSIAGLAFVNPPPEGVPGGRAVTTALGVGTAALWLVVLITVGFYLGARRDLLASLRERAETAEREQALRVEQGQASERARIAREMHDVLAHRISLVSMHAGVLAYREDLTPEQTREVARIIQENAHSSLTELRAVLGSLRQDGEPSAPELPQPTLADVAGLIETERELGTEVHLDDQLKQRDRLSPTVARHAYRIVQEALTNTRKHAAGAPVWVSFFGRPGDGVHIMVRNPLTTTAGVPGARLGLVGLRERAQLVGGTLEAGPDHGDYVVKAWLPWEK